ncbi:HNH endonuclease [Streptomyces sp. NPDC002076]
MAIGGVLLVLRGETTPAIELRLRPNSSVASILAKLDRSNQHLARTVGHPLEWGTAVYGYWDGPYKPLEWERTVCAVSAVYRQDVNWNALTDPADGWERGHSDIAKASQWVKRIRQTFQWTIAAPFRELRGAPYAAAAASEPSSRTPVNKRPQGQPRSQGHHLPHQASSGKEARLLPAPSATSSPTPRRPSALPVTMPVSDYRIRVRALEDARSPGARPSSSVLGTRPQRSREARSLVIQRSSGRCENPRCGNPQFVEYTATGEPILEVDHVNDLAMGGEDHPANMIALCPNCHAVKTRGAEGESMRQELHRVARLRHAAAMNP